MGIARSLWPRTHNAGAGTSWRSHSAEEDRLVSRTLLRYLLPLTVLLAVFLAVAPAAADDGAVRELLEDKIADPFHTNPWASTAQIQ